MKHVLFATLAVGMVVSMSGCGLGAWANRMGEKMPVYGDNSNRCEGYFCFGKKNENTASRHKAPVGTTGKRKLYVAPTSVNPSDPYAGGAPVQQGNDPRYGMSNGQYAGQAAPTPQGGYGGLPPGVVAPPGAPMRAPMPGEEIPDFEAGGNNYAPVVQAPPRGVRQTKSAPSQPNYAPVVRGRQGQGGQPNYVPQQQAASGQLPPSNIPRMAYADELEEEGTFNPDLYRPENVEARAKAQKQMMMREYKDAGLKEHEIYPEWKKDMPEGPLGKIRKDVGW